jgi:hypothetical protein
MVFFQVVSGNKSIAPIPLSQVFLKLFIHIQINSMELR